VRQRISAATGATTPRTSTLAKPIGVSISRADDIDRAPVALHRTPCIRPRCTFCALRRCFRSVVNARGATGRLRGFQSRSVHGCRSNVSTQVAFLTCWRREPHPLQSGTRTPRLDREPPASCAGGGATAGEIRPMPVRRRDLADNRSAPLVDAVRRRSPAGNQPGSDPPICHTTACGTLRQDCPSERETT
jgi:hypothetical protein